MFVKIKYPRTPHLPYSLGYTRDDWVWESDDNFLNKQVVVTTKMDGENTTIYSDGTCHARSLSSTHRSYHSWLLAYIPTIQNCIPDRYRLCGEYLYAKHSIFYDNLESYFLAFCLWNRDNCAITWDEFMEFCNKNNIPHVPVLYEGVYDAKIIKQLAEDTVANGQEGIVVRNRGSFHMSEFKENVAKYVRENHVQTKEHWQYSQITKNLLQNKK